MFFPLKFGKLGPIFFLKNHLYEFKSYFSGLKKKVKILSPPPHLQVVNTFLFVQRIAKRWHFFKKKNILSRISFFD
jgi:hypothetical protein